jgi:putative peptidoglycan lipid II flippase
VASAPTALLQAALLPVLLTHFAERFAEARLADLRALLARALLAAVALVAAVALLLAAARAPLLRLLYQRGAMDAGSVGALAGLLPYHLLGLPGMAALMVLARAHVAVGNTRIMLAMGALSVALNAGLNLLLVHRWGLAGIALATSLVQTAIAVLLWLRLRPWLAHPSRS